MKRYFIFVCYLLIILMFYVLGNRNVIDENNYDDKNLYNQNINYSILNK